MAAVAVAVAGRGHGAVLAVLLAVVLASPVGIATAALAAVATATRWGSSWLVAIGGAQAVLGPAVVVGPARAAASSALAAAALVVAVPGRTIAGALAVGATAGFLFAGPAGLDGVATRAGATLACSLLAYGIGQLRWRRVPAIVALVLAAGAALLAA